MDVSHLTEDEMAEVKKEALERLRPYLVDKLIAERHFDYLRSKKILTREDTEEISCNCTRGKRAGKLLDILVENPLGLDTLIESIQRCRTVNFIIVKITDEVQRVKNEKLEALKAAGGSSSGYSAAKCMPGATNDLSKTDSYDYDKFSTMCLHPDGEGSPASSVMGSSLNLRCVPSGGSAAAVSLNVSSSAASSCLPKPGDPGAPPLPDDLEMDSQDVDAGACGSSADVNFQPLRSRSVDSVVSDPS